MNKNLFLRVFDEFLDRDQFGDFLIRRFENEELRAFQQILLDAIRPLMAQHEGQGDDDRNGNGNDDENESVLPVDEESLAEVEIRRAMEQMVSSEQQHHQQQQVMTPHTLSL